MLRRFLLLILVFAAGAATATYFTAGFVGSASAPVKAHSTAATSPQMPAPQLVPQDTEPAPQRNVRVIPIVRPESETTGAPAAEQEREAIPPPEAAPKQPQCDRRACSRAYRSFDAETCSYQPSRGGPRRLCKK
jgi:hypothetical protein